MLLLMLILAVLPSTPIRSQSVKAGQVLARLKVVSTGEYEVCWEVKKPAGAWTASVIQADRREVNATSIRKSWTRLVLPNAGGKLLKDCSPLHFTAGEVVLLRSETAFSGAVSGTLSFRDEAP